MKKVSTQETSGPFQLLGHAINHIQDRMEAGEDEFSVLVTGELASDDCFQTVLAGFIEDSAYSQTDSPEGETAIRLSFSRARK